MDLLKFKEDLLHAIFASSREVVYKGTKTRVADVALLLKFIDWWFSKLVDKKIVEYLEAKEVEHGNDRLLSN